MTYLIISSVISSSVISIVALIAYNSECNKNASLKHDNQLLLDQIKHMGKLMNENKIRSYKRIDLNLKQAMIQRTQSDIASKLQSYLSAEGIYDQR